MRVWSSTATKAALITLVMLACGCDRVPVFEPDPGDVAVQPQTPIAPGPTDPGPTAPSDPAGPGPTATPTDLLQITTQGDSLFASSGGHVGVGQTARIPIRMRVAGERTYAVVVGQESGACTGRLELVGIADDGTAGMNRALAPSAVLTPADAFTSWFADACYLLAWKVPFGPGGGTYDAEIVIRGVEAGTTLIRTQFEVLGYPGESFRWVVHSKVDVVP